MPYDICLTKYHHSPTSLYTISCLVPFNTLRYNRRSCQNLSLWFSPATPKPSSICLSSFSLSKLLLLPNYNKRIRWLALINVTENLSVKFPQMYSLFPRVSYFAFLRLSWKILKVKSPFHLFFLYQSSDVPVVFIL